MATRIDDAVDSDFVKALPKAELHAHLSGSISPSVLQRLWTRKRADGQCLDLDDPLTAIRPGEGFVDVVTFFPLFDKYIYKLVDDVWAVKEVTTQVLQDFQDDGVGYLELRTTPREHVANGMSKAAYVAAVVETLREWNENAAIGSTTSRRKMMARLILCIDRGMNTCQADEVIDLAIKYKCADIELAHETDLEEADDNGARPLSRFHPKQSAPVDPRYVVGIDLCGNPTRGDINTFTAAFARAKFHGLGATVHFAEVPQSSTSNELEVILSWAPDRLGHVINVPPEHRRIIEDRKLALELCLSCNVLAKLTSGGFTKHHFGGWWGTACPIALSTDDVGIFGSPLSNEYSLAAMYFGLSRTALIELGKRAARASFGGREHMLDLIREFEGRQGQLERLATA